MRKMRAILIGGIGGLALGGLARADVVNFNSANDLTGKFNLNVQTGTTATPGYPGFSAVGSGGVGDSGAVDVLAGPSATLDTTAVYNVQSYDPANGTVTLSQFVKVLPTVTIGDRLLQLGLIDDLAADRRLNGGTGTTAAHADFISARVFPTVASAAGATTSPFTFQVQAGQSTNGAATLTTNTTQTPNFDLVLGDWYQLSIDINKSATANTFLVGGTLQDFGTDGLTPGATMTFAPQSINSANTVEIYNDPTTYASFRSHAAQGGADLLDNFSVAQAAAPVPEPASIGALGLAAMAMMGRRRKK